MNVIDVYDTQEVDKEIERLNEKITTLEKTNDDLVKQINQRDAYLKVCYVNIACLSIILLIIGSLFFVKKIRKGK